MERVLKRCSLAIIIPVLNCLDFTREMIETIKTKHPYKLILIDNGSTDGTVKYFLGLQNAGRAVCFFNKENKGVCPSWNYGIKYAIKNFGSRYFFIPNNDALLHPKCIDVLLEAIKSPRVALTTAFDVSGRVGMGSEVKSLPVPKVKELTESPDFSCFLLKKETIDKVGYFDEKFFPAYFEDNDYHYRINLAGLKAFKTNQALYFHWGSRTIKGGPEIKKVSRLAYLVNRDYYRQKWGGEPGEEVFTRPFGGKEW